MSDSDPPGSLAVMLRLRKAVRRGERRIGVVDLDLGAPEESAREALLLGESSDGRATRLWHIDLPARMLSPSKRSWEEQEAFAEWWMRGEELAREYNRQLSMLPKTLDSPLPSC